MRINILKDKENAQRRVISQWLIDALGAKKSFSDLNELKAYANHKVLLSELELFDRRYKGDNWDLLKNQVSQFYLMNHARRYYRSIFWVNRNFSARCFALTPFPQDQQRILKLLEDSVFLVRSLAVSATIKLEIKQGILKILHLMSDEQGYDRYFYRDMLINKGSLQVFIWIKDFAYLEKDSKIHLSCLDILARKSIPIPEEFLSRDLDSNDKTLQLAALKVYANNPQSNSLPVLLKYISSIDPQFRAQAALGLQYFLTKESLDKLEEALSDPSWMVRQQAGWSLKKMGNAGVDILRRQPQNNKEAYESAQYALKFDW
ncbi:MAG: hypothetical protein BGO14_08745 [Chlamydiales bacterium 38-26]|nr:HEAT repeat domain-containing protein [Chlamydiales bacterium]OJV11072.1 MAG: hypothetical protein BGO14_08745 [Chlamydiales bacterium 38-26]